MTWPMISLPTSTEKNSEFSGIFFLVGENIEKNLPITYNWWVISSFYYYFSFALLDLYISFAFSIAHGNKYSNQQSCFNLV
jgi:hypothetical protein